MKENFVHLRFRIKEQEYLLERYTNILFNITFNSTKMHIKILNGISCFAIAKKYDDIYRH
jgi:hypothetical protein